MSSKNTDERFTPKKYVDSVRLVLGEIDLDPASSFVANQRIKAVRYFSEGDSGLNHHWHGNVFCNPPYSRGNLLIWSKKIVKEFEEGNLDNGIYLVPFDPSTEWFKVINGFPFCATDHRLNFLEYNSNLKKFFFLKNPENASCFFLFSNSILVKDLFVTHFSKYGPIYKKVNKLHMEF